jgi:glycerol-3-phosphate dehydrogenase
MIARDPGSASHADHDLVVVGGGVQGVALTLEAARRGLRPVLLERGDFGGETSWNSLRIVHGGLRYLQSLDLGRFRESVTERRWWLANFPDLVKPLPCLMPLYGDGPHRPGILRLALLANDLLSMRRNEGVAPDLVLNRGRLLSARETIERFPAVNRDGLQGGALWYDAAMPDSERLLVEMLRWAADCGGVALNYIEARRMLQREGSAAGVEALDRLSGQTLEFRAPVVVNCAGPWCREVARRFDRDIPRLFNFSIAFNVVLDMKPLSEAALAVKPGTRKGRHYFLHPWKGMTLAGTFHAPWPEAREPGREGEPLVGAFIADLDRSLHGLEITRKKVIRVQWGLLPARRAGAAETAARAVIHHHGDGPGPGGLFSVSGVKWTTARLVAEKTLRHIFRVRGEILPPPGGRPRPGPGRSVSLPEAERLLESDRQTLADHVLGLVRTESVVHLDDLVLRRTDWGVDPECGLAMGVEAAGLTGWDGAKVRQEQERLAGILGKGPWAPSARDPRNRRSGTRH